jgi:hypothetical protein
MPVLREFRSAGVGAARRKLRREKIMNGFSPWRTWLRGYWQHVGPTLMRNEGVETITPEQQRDWMLKYIDGESPSEAIILRWKKLSPEEKQHHLLDAFPDVS